MAAAAAAHGATNMYKPQLSCSCAKVAMLACTAYGSAVPKPVGFDRGCANRTSDGKM